MSWLSLTEFKASLEHPTVADSVELGGTYEFRYVDNVPHEKFGFVFPHLIGARRHPMRVTQSHETPIGKIVCGIAVETEEDGFFNFQTALVLDNAGHVLHAEAYDNRNLLPQALQHALMLQKGGHLVPAPEIADQPIIAKLLEAPIGSSASF